MFWQTTTITKNRHFSSFSFRKVNIFSFSNGYVDDTIHSNNASWINNATNAWRVRLKCCIFSATNLLYIHGVNRQSGNLKAHSGDLRRPQLNVPSSGGNGIDILNIYEDHNLPSVVRLVTCDLALSHESRLAARHSRLTIRDSRLSILCDSKSAD